MTNAFLAYPAPIIMIIPYVIVYYFIIHFLFDLREEAITQYILKFHFQHTFEKKLHAYFQNSYFVLFIFMLYLLSMLETCRMEFWSTFLRHCFSFQIIMRAYKTLIKTFVLIVNGKQYKKFVFYTYFSFLVLFGEIGSWGEFSSFSHY